MLSASRPASRGPLSRSLQNLSQLEAQTHLPDIHVHSGYNACYCCLGFVGTVATLIAIPYHGITSHGRRNGSTDHHGSPAPLVYSKRRAHYRRGIEVAVGDSSVPAHAFSYEYGRGSLYLCPEEPPERYKERNKASISFVARLQERRRRMTPA